MLAIFHTSQNVECMFILARANGYIYDIDADECEHEKWIHIPLPFVLVVASEHLCSHFLNHFIEVITQPLHHIIYSLVTFLAMKKLM